MGKIIVPHEISPDFSGHGPNLGAITKRPAMTVGLPSSKNFQLAITGWRNSVDVIRKGSKYV